MKKWLYEILWGWFVDKKMRLNMRLCDLRDRQKELTELRDDAKKRHAKHSHLQKKLNKVTAELILIENEISPEALKG